MILVKAPLRITLAGGATDLPFYADAFGGYVISSTINKHVYVALHKSFDSKIRMKYSEYEIVDEPHQLKHKVANEILSHYDLRGVELSSFSDIPGATGLGSSGAFTLATLLAVKTYLNEDFFMYEVVREAAEIENKLWCGGYQDPAISAYGGISLLTGNNRDIRHKKISLDFESLQQSIMLFSTNSFHDSSKILRDITENDKIEVLHKIKSNAVESLHLLKDNEFAKYGDLVNSYWKLKKQTSSKVSNFDLDNMVEKALNLGADGAKILGAGGGGYLFVIAVDPKIREILRRAFTMSDIHICSDKAVIAYKSKQQNFWYKTASIGGVEFYARRKL